MSANGKFNWALIVAACIAAAPPTAVAWMALRQTQETHLEINSRMTRLLELTETSAKALGVKEERERHKEVQEEVERQEKAR